MNGEPRGLNRTPHTFYQSVIAFHDLLFTVHYSPFTIQMDSFFKLSYDPALYIDDAFNKLSLSDELPNTTLLMEIQ